MTHTSYLYCPKEKNSHDKHECEIELLLEEINLRRSKDRHHLISLLSEKRTWSIPELCKELHNTDISTVYRNIDTLFKKGIIESITTHENEIRFEWAIKEHHDHNNCAKCKTIECVPCPIPKIKNHSLQLNKLCKTCK